VSSAGQPYGRTPARVPVSFISRDLSVARVAGARPEAPLAPVSFIYRPANFRDLGELDVLSTKACVTLSVCDTI
jgi:hypothetical protein